MRQTPSRYPSRRAVLFSNGYECVTKSLQLAVSYWQLASYDRAFRHV